MSNSVRAHRATHAPDARLEPVLPEMKRAIEDHGELDAETLKELAGEVHMPVAAVRGALSSYHDVHAAQGAVKVCAGTSCVLSGAGAVSRSLGERGTCQGVYCLGYCDRSPAAMTASGHVAAPVGQRDVEALLEDRELPYPPPPSIRNEARHAIVTARLLGKAAPSVAPEYAGLQRAIVMKPEDVLAAMIDSGVRGRGGAAFPTGNKLKFAAAAKGSPKYIVANGDEGDPGSFIDRELMERDPHGIIEGMAIAAHAIGASEGIVFIRSEYPLSVRVMEQAIAAATNAGRLGANALGPDRPFRVRVVQGMGSYVCGEETALLNAIEGQRGEVRPRPPYPVEQGLFGKPTVVDNVETLVNFPWIMLHGAQAFNSMGTADSKGTKALCFNRGFAKPGIVEVEFGVTLRDAIERLGGGGANGTELEAVLLGGPMGSIVTPDQWDAPICFAGMAKRGITLGHAGLVAIPRGTDWRMLLRHMLTFMRDESCGKCVPCRLGTLRAHEIARNGLSDADRPRFEAILAIMKDASLCAFGRETPNPIQTILTKFGDRIRTEARS